MSLGTNKIIELNNFSFLKRVIEILLIFLPISLVLSNIVAEVIVILLIIFYFYIQKFNDIVSDIQSPIIFILIIFWLYLLINYFVNLDNDPSFLRTIFFIRFPLLILSISFFLNSLEINEKRIFKFWLGTVLIICIDLFIQYFYKINITGNPAILQGNIYRLGGFMSDELKISNLVFHFGTLIFTYFFTESFSRGNKFSFIYTLFFIFLIATIFITGERSNFITIVIFFFIFSLFLLFKNKKIFVIFVTLCSLIIVFLSMNNKYLKERMITTNVFVELKKLEYDPNKSYLNKDSVYFAHYSTAYQIFQKNKFFGVGLKNFRNFCDNSEFNKNIYPSLHDRKCATHPHNFYFEFLSEIGSLGFLLIISFFTYSFYVFLKHRNNFIFLTCIILLVNFIPFLPRGSFFTNWNAIILWTVFAFIFSRCIKLEK